ncbi:MAG: division plane positioning ATPase MipZ [Polymorphobacter sp.]
MAVLEDFSLSHVAARAELRALVTALALPRWDAAAPAPVA